MLTWGPRRSGLRKRARALRSLDVNTELPIVCVQRSRLDVHTELAIVCLQRNRLDVHTELAIVCVGGWVYVTIAKKKVHSPSLLLSLFLIDSEINHKSHYIKVSFTIEIWIL